MQPPVMRGVIDRRILVNYRVDPDILAAWLPPPFRPKRIGGFGLAGICLIRLRNLRPRGIPAFCGLGSENAAHRVAVEWDDNGTVRSGVYVPRRDTSSWLNVAIGGRLFPGVHHLSRFDVRESDDRYHVGFAHRDGMRVAIDARLVEKCPSDSVFDSTAKASEFFDCGSLGYSATAKPGVYEGLELRTWGWKIEPLAVEHAESSLFDDRQVFPAGSIEFDSAFVMRNVEHEWHACESIRRPSTAAVFPSAVGI